MESSINSWEGGLNGDLSRIHLKPNQYRSASNFRILTDKGSSSFSLENIKGNVFNKIIPNIGAVQKITIDAADNTQTIAINGSTPVIFDTTNQTPEDLYNFISTDASFAAEYNIQYNVYYNSLFVLIVPIQPFSLFITEVGSGLTLDTSYIPAQPNLEVIGSTSINDDIYLLTTNGTSKSPTTDYGQIWKLVLNDADNSSVLTLIYNNKINFSAYNAIAPTAITGRYENASIQRIYWTDFYNKVRQINVKDPQAFALDISLLELVPAIDFDIPLLSEIHEGGVATVKVGVWQAAYRFKNTTGSVTAFSPLSNIVPIVNHRESIAVLAGSNNFPDYIGDAYGTTTTKVVSWTINNLDPDYDRIECVLLVREKKDDVPAIYSFNEETISGRESITITVDGDILAGADTTTLTLSEFLALSGSFTHAKTITTKDNRLIAGNIRTASADIDFDARAYRFPISDYNLSLTEDGVTTIYNTNPWSTPADWANIVDESDAINPSNNVNRYKRGSTILGGEGLNISYEFISVAIKSDVANNISSNFDFLTVPASTPPSHLTYLDGFRSTSHDFTATNLDLDLNVYSSDIDNIDVLQEYTLSLPQVMYKDMKYPQYNSNYWGYQQNETYRFVIQFYDKAKNPYFAKWIGDIQFPDITDFVEPQNTMFDDGTPTGEVRFVKSFVSLATGTTAIAYITQLGIKFNVSIPAELTEIISGYSIGRVKRTESDKTVIAEGIITSVGDVFTVGHYNTAQTKTTGVETPFLDNYTTPEDRVCFFITPNLLDGTLTQPRATDRLNIRAGYGSAANTNSTDLNNPGADLYTIYRLYNDVSIGLVESHILDQSLLLAIDNNGIAFNGFSVHNSDAQEHSVGGNCYFFSFGTNSPAGIQKIYNDTNYKLYATVDRILTNQYGGNTYGDRANNEYISCSHFRSIKNSVTAYADSPLIFGGDTMNYHTDMQRSIKDWGGAGIGKYSTTFIYPAGACLNAGFRYGTFPNRSMQSDLSTDGSATETYDYNNVYSAENDIVKFFPKPEPFLINDEFVNRFVISEVKINGELNDSWSVFLPLNYWDVEGTYGPINACDVLNDQVYFAQDRAFGQLLVNPRTAIAGTDGEIIQLGKGDIIDSHKYASTEIGSKHQFSFLKSAYNIFFLDIRHKKIYAFNPSKGLEPLTDTKGMHGWLQNNVKNKLESIDKPVYDGDNDDGQNGIHGVYDYVNNELIYTIFEQADTRDELNKFTIVFNDSLNLYTADNYSHYPKIYITNHRKFLSPNPSSSTTYKNLYLHNFGEYGNFYGAYFDSEVEFLSNKYPEVSKVFTNLSWETELQDGTTLVDIDSGLTPVRESFTSLEVSTDYQSNSVIFNLLTNLRRRFRTWTSEIPKDAVQSAYMSAGFFGKMRDKVLKLKFSYTNNNNRRLIVHRITTFFGLNTPK